MKLNNKGDFVITNYQREKAFSSFLPGIAGKMGVPVWAFYVNRGQGIAGFGIKDKDQSIMEFNPANKAYQLTPLKGFRTFIKFIGRGLVYEPFSGTNLQSEKDVKTEMMISPHTLTLKEVNNNLGLEIRVKYFTLPGESFGALVRRVYVRNLASNIQKVEILDGLPELIPAGISNQALKDVSQTMSAWCQVDNLEERVPFFRLRASAEDTPEVRKMVAGHFYLSYYADEQGNKLIQPLVDPEVIFAEDKSFFQPLNFYQKRLASYQGKQLLENRYPAAMSAVVKELKQGEEFVLNSLYGHTDTRDKLIVIKERVLRSGYLAVKEKENRELHNYYLDYIFTVSNHPRFDQYCRQTYLDNILRGGFPVEVGNHIYHLYSRKHGDLERDYNFFQLEPNYFSQGNGNYRDVNQNRRCDNFFNPGVKEANIKVFANLIQADGFNPLVIKGLVFSLKGHTKDEILAMVTSNRELLAERLEGEFTPGSLAMFITNNKIELDRPLEKFIDCVLKKAGSRVLAEHGEGFWIDHWTYLLDLIENYLAVYPEKVDDLLVNDDTYTFYDNYVQVQPRREKYVLTDSGPRQLGAVKVDEEKKKMIARRDYKPNQLWTERGEGDVFATNLLVKLLTIVVNKLSSLDPQGIGLEMEANKPGWYDALNGLPGIFGSSTPETMELYRLVNFLIDMVKELEPEIKLPEEIYHFIKGLHQALLFWQEEGDDQDYWQEATGLREDYRRQVFPGFTGKLREMSVDELLAFLHAGQEKLTEAIKKAYDQDSGLYHTYYYYLPEDIEEREGLSPEGYPYISVKSFKQQILPPFLEGQVRAMKVIKEEERAQKLHRSVCESELYDQKLKMFRLNGDLSAMPDDIGRARAFSPGWLENGSIWLHMEYKYLLELLKKGLYEEFYQILRDVLIPFQDPARYGRSILENSSFIMSSLNPDTENQGRGFIARLSGSTAEFIHIWSLLVFGPHPFKYSDGELIFNPQPALEADFFTGEEREVTIQWSEREKKTLVIPAHSFAYRLLGHTIVIYHNPEKKNTFGNGRARIKEFVLTIKDQEVNISGELIAGEYAEMLRKGEVDQLDVYLS